MKFLNVGWVTFAMMIAIMVYSVKFGSFGGGLLFITVGYIGAVIGNAVREYAMPDVYFTDGTVWENVKTRFFWNHGPQLAGFFLIYMIGLKIASSFSGE